MEDLKSRQKKEAVRRMKLLRMLPQPIKEFEEDGKLNLSERGGFLYWLDEEEEQMVRKFEKRFDAVAYHVIKSYTNIGLMYAILYVGKYEDEWKIDLEDLKGGQVLAYVVNRDMPDCSELGYIGVSPCIGGVRRTW